MALVQQQVGQNWARFANVGIAHLYGSAANQKPQGPPNGAVDQGEIVSRLEPKAFNDGRPGREGSRLPQYRLVECLHIL